MKSKKTKKQERLVHQKNKWGKLEKLPAAEYSVRIKCKNCGGKRFIKPQDVHKVKEGPCLCHPCQRERRNAARRKH